MIKIGMTSMTFQNHTPDEVIQLAKQQNLYGIEWGVRHIPDGGVKLAEEIGRKTRAAGLAVLSYSTYYHVGDAEEEFVAALESATALGAPIMRIWTPYRPPRLVPDAEFDQICVKAYALAETAELAGVKLNFEYHFDTLTETSAGAVRLIRQIGHTNTGLYWQPDGSLSTQQNLAALKEVLPYVTGNIHMINYKKGGVYESLEPMRDGIIQYFCELEKAKRDFCVMIEFAKDDQVENFIKSAVLLKELAAVSEDQ